MLEPPESHGTLVEVLVGLRLVHAEAAHIVVHPPEFPVAVPIAEAAVVIAGGDEVDSGPGVRLPLPDEAGDGVGVGHQLHRIVEHIFIDLLEHIFVTGVGRDLISGIDVAVAELLAGDRSAIHLKFISCRNDLHSNATPRYRVFPKGTGDAVL